MIKSVIIAASYVLVALSLVGVVNLYTVSAWCFALMLLLNAVERMTIAWRDRR